MDGTLTIDALMLFFGEPSESDIQALIEQNPEDLEDQLDEEWSDKPEHYLSYYRTIFYLRYALMMEGWGIAELLEYIQPVFDHLELDYDHDRAVISYKKKEHIMTPFWKYEGGDDEMIDLFDALLSQLLQIIEGEYVLRVFSISVFTSDIHFVLLPKSRYDLLIQKHGHALVDRYFVDYFTPTSHEDIELDY